MAKKAAEKTPKRELSTVLYNEVLDLPEGKTLRMVFDVAQTLISSKNYIDEFTTLRHIPFDIENLSPRDPVIKYLVAKYADKIKAKIMKESDITYRVQQFYRLAAQDVQRDANMVAIFEHPDNLALLSEDPTPYEDSAVVENPLIMSMPVIVKDIAWPLERRLKRLMDVLITSGAIFRVDGLLEHLSVRMNVFAQELVEVDAAGFLDEPVDGSVSPEAIPAS